MNFSQYALGVGLTLTGLCVTVSPAKAVSLAPTLSPTFGSVEVSAEVNGVQYNITTVQGSYATPLGNSAIEGPLDGLLRQQPWWQNSALAKEVATRVGVSLGLGNIPRNVQTSNQNNEGPYFAFGFDPVRREDNIPGVVLAWNWDGDKNQVESDFYSNGKQDDLIWAVVKPADLTGPSGPATPVPTPVLLPAILGVGAKLLRRQQQASPEQS